MTLTNVVRTIFFHLRNGQKIVRTTFVRVIVTNVVRTIFWPLRKWKKIVRTTFVRVIYTHSHKSVPYPRFYSIRKNRKAILNRWLGVWIPLKCYWWVFFFSRTKTNATHYLPVNLTTCEMLCSLTTHCLGSSCHFESSIRQRISRGHKRRPFEAIWVEFRIIFELTSRRSWRFNTEA